ncbi:serine hydrolase domain-containing protein [Amycolatopsis suaedae]|uniref:Class A beta-lactamase-related serine hydrolase n=1 Tax=Amycolatopsis suaedae TaxID=2510978 RepID=A0A4Q7J590_9PSEU|nr:serine hydrolase domain-containing protein [Amycolatopsis suaedae]RZQ61896.1 class A beta-lactamase-related serine hydrolase [Amycolatopsis suaedae]
MTDGLSSRKLSALDSVLNTEVERGGLPGAVLAVAHHGKLAHLRAYGYRDPAAGVPMTEDTLFWLASMSKPVTTAGALLLHEQGLLPLGTPVGELLPPLADRVVGERREPAIRQPTVLDLLRHTSGMVEGMLGSTPVHQLYTEAFGNGMTSYTGAEFVERLAPLPLLHQPGERWHYGWGLDLTGLVIEAVTGQRLGDYLAQRLFTPLGMTDTGFGVPGGDAHRYARALPGHWMPDLSIARFDSGGAGLVGTASDYLRFAQLLLDGGGELLGRKTVEHMLTDRLDPGTDLTSLAAMEPASGFGLGVAVRRGSGGATTAGSPGEVTWPGVSGTYWWADPVERLAVVFMAHAPARRYHPLIRTLVLSALR